MTDHLTIRSHDGLTLEAAIDQVAQPKGAVVFCHPHPSFGGTMNAPLLTALRDDLLSRGFSTLRFNFRGVGESEGTSSLGPEEVADALGAVDAARGQWPGLEIALLGWSFGGAVAIRTAAQTDVAACVAIAPSVEPKPDVTAGLPDPAQVALETPLLLVIGVNDELISPAAAKAWAAGVEGARYVEMPGANHFFWAKYEDLAALIGDWLEEEMG